MQLVAYGAQDIYLTGNPQITFFKVVYRRHTNFSMETIQQTLRGTTTAADGATAECTVSRNGDLVYKVYVTAPALAETKGSSLLKEVELEIGGQRIDRHYQEWNDIWNELTTPSARAEALKAMQCEVGTGGDNAVIDIHIPVNFWFCRNPGLALPLIALQYHEVKIKFTWGSTTSSLVPKVWCDYIYLDTDERRRFAQVSHEYLIEQLQKEDKTISSTSVSEKLHFNHPVKELLWTYDNTITLTDGKLVLNGHDRFAPQSEEYFTLRQPFDYHTAVPHQNLPLAHHIQQDHKTFVEFAGHTADGVYAGHNAGTGDGNLFVNATNIKFEGAGSPGFTSAYAGGFMIAIVPVTAGTGNKTVAGRIYYATVPASASNVTVSTNAVALVPITMLQDQYGHQIVTGINATTGGTYKIYHSVGNHVPIPHSQARTSQITRKIGVYSFALKPEEHQPSGTCNFSRIDNAQLQMTSSDGSPSANALRIYAVNYNVLRIMSGMGGLAYSN